MWTFWFIHAFSSGCYTKAKFNVLPYWDYIFILQKSMILFPKRLYVVFSKGPNWHSFMLFYRQYVLDNPLTGYAPRSVFGIRIQSLTWSGSKPSESSDPAPYTHYFFLPRKFFAPDPGVKKNPIKVLLKNSDPKLCGPQSVSGCGED